MYGPQAGTTEVRVGAQAFAHHASELRCLAPTASQQRSHAARAGGAPTVCRSLGLYGIPQARSLTVPAAARKLVDANVALPLPPHSKGPQAGAASGIDRTMSESPTSVMEMTEVRNILPQAVPRAMLSAAHGEKDP